MATKRLRIVIGHAHSGAAEALYIGDSGQDAQAAFASATHATHSHVDLFAFPQPTRRRRLSPDLPEPESERVAEESVQDEPATEEVPESETPAKRRKARA